MLSLEKMAVGAVLNRIRARRDIPVRAYDPRAAERIPTSGGLALREAKSSDFKSIADLKGRYGIVVDPPDNWSRLWRHNPALAGMKTEPVMGWVLESEGKIVGYLGNIYLSYRYGVERLTAAVGSGLVVEPPHRIFTMWLIRAFFQQKGVDLYLGTTAIEPVVKIAQCFGADLLPQTKCDIVYFWILRPYRFAESLAKQMRLSKPMSYLSGVAVALALGTDRILRKRKPIGVSRRFLVAEKGVDEVGGECEALWIQKLGGETRLFADRSANTLRWHFDIPGFKGTVRVLCCYSAHELVGYVILRTNSRGEDGLRRTKVADILASGDDQEVLRALLGASYSHAVREGSDVFEIGCVPLEVQRVIAAQRPYVRNLPGCPFFYKANDQGLHQALASGSAWYASAYDGDTTLIP